MTVHCPALVVIAIALSANISAQAGTPTPLLMDGHVHITDRVYREGSIRGGRNLSAIGIMRGRARAEST